MIKAYNPAGIAPPASRYSHVVEVVSPARWLHISGQVGVAPDGKVREGLAAQLDQCFANIDAALAGAGMTKANLVKITVFLTVPGSEAVTLYRQRRDAWIGSGGHAPAATYLCIQELASPAFLCEVEAVAAG
ncbi:MAG: RidA family protein [Hyphomicrobiaceae bacterium]